MSRLSIDTLMATLGLPDSTRPDQPRVPKKLLLEQGMPTAADRRLIQDGLEEMLWLASLKPTNVGVPTYQDTGRAYVEIAVIGLRLRDTAKSARLAEIVHRTVPHPVLLLSEQRDTLTLSVAHKRTSLGEAERKVLEGSPVTTPPLATTADTRVTAFLASLPLARQPQANLYALYQGWLEAIEALNASWVCGEFRLPSSPEAAGARREAMERHGQLAREIATLRASAARETQMSRRVELNLAIKQREADLARLTQCIKGNAHDHPQD